MLYLNTVCRHRDQRTQRPSMPTTLPQFLQDLRRTEIVDRVMRDPRSRGDLLLGVDRQAAMDTIGWGQADFDQPFGSLSAEDRVLLYAYWNQPRHLEELSEAFRQMFGEKRPGEPTIVVDVGCGPFTGGLAFAGQLEPQERFDYIGVDRSQEMQRFGEQLAAAAQSMTGTPQVNRQWASALSSVAWPHPTGWRPVIIVVSFLLASPSLEAKTLVADLTHLLSRLSRGEATVLYTNSPKAGPNRSFPVFREALTDAGFRLVADDTGSVETERRLLELRYALFHRRRQRTLRLGDS